MKFTFRKNLDDSSKIVAMFGRSSFDVPEGYDKVAIDKNGSVYAFSKDSKVEPFSIIGVFALVNYVGDFEKIGEVARFVNDDWIKTLTNVDLPEIVELSNVFISDAKIDGGFITRHIIDNENKTTSSHGFVAENVKVSSMLVSGKLTSTSGKTGGSSTIEMMPIGAALTGVYDSEIGDMVKIHVKPVSVEVDGETVTFLLHQAYRKGSPFCGEVSMKRGTKVTWEI